MFKQSTTLPKFFTGRLSAEWACYGFTLIELMITLTVAAITLMVAAPNFSNLIKDNRMTAQSNAFVTAMNLARSEAIKRGLPVNISSLDGSLTTNEWGPGWNVVDNGGTLIRVFPPLASNATLDSSLGATTFQYASSGLINNPDTLYLCDDRTGAGRRIQISSTGRTKVDKYSCP